MCEGSLRTRRSIYAPSQGRSGGNTSKSNWNDTKGADDGNKNNSTPLGFEPRQEIPQTHLIASLRLKTTRP